MMRVCVCVRACVSVVRGAAACVRPQPTSAVRIAAGTGEDFKKGTQTGLRLLAPPNKGPDTDEGPRAAITLLD